MIEKKDPMTGKSKKYPYGNKTKVKVVKNKLDGTQGQDGEFFIRYGYGLDNYYSIIETGSVLGVMKKEGAGYYSFGQHRIQGRDKFRAFLAENPKVYEDLCSKVTTAIAASATAVSDDDIGEEDDIMSEYETDMGDSSSSGVSEEVIEASDAE
jgi:recombination protein RecA